MLRGDVHGALDAREDAGTAGVEGPVEGRGGEVFLREIWQGGEKGGEDWGDDGGGEFGDAG